jgi:hypothetical protein
MAPKKLLIYGVLCSIVGIALIDVAWDLARILDPGPAPPPQTLAMQALRLAVVVLCNILVQLIGRDGQGGRLATSLGIAFVLILLADLLLTFGQTLAGVAVFACRAGPGPGTRASSTARRCT